MVNHINKIIIVILFIGTFNLNFAQAKISGGADFASRYIWRGLDFGNTFSVQPSLTFNIDNFSAGLWGSYPLVNTANGNEEMDFFLEYSMANFSILVTDYYFPNSGLKYGNFKEPGAHTLEVGLSYAGTEAFPISASVFMNVYNDIDNTIYFEIKHSTQINEINIDFFLGGTPGGKNKYYNTYGFNLINIGTSVSKNISMSDDLSLNIYTTYIINPNLEIGYLLFGLNIGI